MIFFTIFLYELNNVKLVLTLCFATLDFYQQMALEIDYIAQMFTYEVDSAIILFINRINDRCMTVIQINLVCKKSTKVCKSLR